MRQKLCEVDLPGSYYGFREFFCASGVIVALLATRLRYAEDKFQQRRRLMPFWSKNLPKFETIDTLIQEQPGLKPAEIARILEVARSTIIRSLPSLEEAGFLYSEDQRGGLWPFKHEE